MKKYEKYAPSSLSGIEAIPSHWREAPIKQLVEINPETLGEKTDADLLINYIDIGNVNSYGEIKEIQPIVFKDAPSRARRIVKKGDVVVSTVRTYLKAIAAVESDEENLIASTGFAVLRADEKNVAAAYLKYAVRGGYFIEEVVANSTGVSYPAISSTPFGRIKLLLPTYEEQRAIAAHLDRKTAQLDTLMAQKEALLQRLHQQRQALINEAVTQGLDPVAPRKPSGVAWLGEVPAHWGITQLKHVTDFINGAAFKPEDWVNEGVPIVRIQNLNGNQNFNFISPEAEVKESCHLHGGELLFSWSGNVGTSFGPFMWEREGLSYLNQHIFKLDKYDLHQKYFYWLLKAVTKYIESKTHGIIGMVHVTKPEIGAVPIPKISFQEQEAIADYLDLKMGLLDEAAAAIHTQIKVLKTYRQSLISEVVTGKVDVRPAAVEAPAAGTQTRLWS